MEKGTEKCVEEEADRQIVHSHWICSMQTSFERTTQAPLGYGGA